MPKVLTTMATIQCPHGGVGTTTASSPLVDVQGGTVTVEGDTGTLSCVFTPPCVGYTLASMGLNATTIDGKRVILVTDFQKSQTGVPLVLSETTVLIDDSTPSALPSGKSSAPIAPELLDLVPPSVVAVPPTMPFTVSVMQPATAAIVFTLTASFPLSWSLRLLNTTAGTSQDATNGLPSGLVVTPAGGDWSSPVLVVTATMTAAFMASLAPGTHWLYMTGVSKRGLSALGKASIVVS